MKNILLCLSLCLFIVSEIGCSKNLGCANVDILGSVGFYDCEVRAKALTEVMEANIRHFNNNNQQANADGN